jgi:predicted ATP-grasp superfamily ATP-dependent carboligase
MRAGFQVVAADLFSDADLRQIAPATQIDRYPEGLLDWLRRLQPKPDAWMYTGALENHPELVDAMASVAPLWGNGAEALREVRSPLKLAEFLQADGLLFPETRETLADLPQDGSWLAKTGRGASGSGVRAFTNDASQVADRVYQRRVAGIPYSAVYVAGGGNAALLGVVEQLVGENWLHASEFQYCGAIGPLQLPPEICDEIGRIGCRLARHFGLKGLFGVDLMIAGEQVWTIEVNPRYTASTEVVERGTKVLSIAAHSTACINGDLVRLPDESAFDPHGKAILFARKSVRIGHAFAQWAKNELVHLPWPTLADIPDADSTIKQGQPVLTVFADSGSADDLKQNLQNRVAEIERKLYAY